MDLKSVIDYFGLDKDAVASVLWPDVKHPKMSLYRILDGSGELSSSQVERLADHIGVPVSDLYTCDTWGLRTENGELRFRKGEYSVKADAKFGIAYIYWGNLLIAKKTYSTGMKISEFINLVEETIKEVRG